MPLGFSLQDLINSSQFSNGIGYDLRYANAPISSVSINLSDMSRQMVIRGTSQAKVESLTATLQSLLNKHTTPFGGWTFRFIAGSVLLLCAISLTIAGLANPLTFSRVIRWTFVGAGILGALAILFLPWARWISGTAIYQGSASVITRESALFTFYGFLFSILSIVIGMWAAFRKSYASVPDSVSLHPSSKKRSGVD